MLRRGAAVSIRPHYIAAVEPVRARRPASQKFQEVEKLQRGFVSRLFR
jgi:hypothetical protein